MDPHYICAICKCSTLYNTHSCNAALCTIIFIICPTQLHMCYKTQLHTCHRTQPHTCHRIQLHTCHRNLLYTCYRNLLHTCYRTQLNTCYKTLLCTRHCSKADKKNAAHPNLHIHMPTTRSASLHRQSISNITCTLFLFLAKQY